MKIPLKVLEHRLTICTGIDPEGSILSLPCNMFKGNDREGVCKVCSCQPNEKELRNHLSQAHVQCPMNKFSKYKTIWLSP